MHTVVICIFKWILLEQKLSKLDKVIVITIIALYHEHYQQKFLQRSKEWLQWYFVIKIVLTYCEKKMF